MRKYISSALLTAALISGCTSNVAPTEPRSLSGFPVTIVDDEGTRVTLRRAPKRIVSFAPSMTETLFAIGMGSRIVGVTSADDYPPAAKAIQQVSGAPGEPNIEKVVSARPDLMLTAFRGGKSWKQKLRTAGVTLVTFDATSVQDSFDDMRRVGKITGAGAADRVVDGLEAKTQEIQKKIAGARKPSVFYEVYSPPLTTVGGDTFISDLISRAGGRNVASGARGYPEWSLEKLIASDPAVYFVSDSSGQSAQSVATRPGYDNITAVKLGKVVLAPASLVERPGPRVASGMQRLAGAIHPEAFAR